MTLDEVNKIMFNPDPKPLKRKKNKRRQISHIAEKKVSDKAMYNKDSKRWIIGKRCGCGCGKTASTVHHKRGRDGYADNNKYFSGIKLLNDKDFWFPACMDCHIEIENNPEWAYKNGYSESRAKNIYR